MSGLINAGIMQGFGNGMSTIGNFLMQQQAREDDREQRAAERRELQTERLDARKEQAVAGRSGSGPFQTSMPEDGMTEEMAAARMNMTIPEFRQFRKMQKTGDSSGYDKDITTGIVDESGGDPYAPEVKLETKKGKPAGFDQWAADKRKALADIQAELTFGDKYDDVVRGRRGQQEIDASSRAEQDPSKAGVIGQAMAAGAGKPLNSQGVNSYTGEANEVGDSVITKNERAPSGKGGSGGSAYDREGAKLVDSARQEVAGIRKELSKLQEGFSTPKKEAEVNAKKAELQAATQRLRDAETRLAGSRGTGNNGNVKSGGAAAGGARPSLGDIFKK